MLAEQFLLKMENSRSLFGLDLARFFKLIKQLQDEDDMGDADLYDKLIMNVSCNLKTVGVNLLWQVEGDSNDISIGTDSSFKGANADRFEKDRQYKQMIFDMYKGVFTRHPELFEDSQSYVLSPLGMIFAELFESMNFDDRHMCLSMLGDVSVDNYSQDFS